MEIEEICRRARAEGLSYGQYVFKHKVELAGKRPAPKTPEGATRCRHCKRAFIPTNSKHVFCGASCRVMWNRKRRYREKKEKGE